MLTASFLQRKRSLLFGVEEDRSSGVFLASHALEFFRDPGLLGRPFNSHELARLLAALGPGGRTTKLCLQLRALLHCRFTGGLVMDIYDDAPWTEDDIDNLRGVLERGGDIEEAAELLCRSGSVCHVGRKAAELGVRYQGAKPMAAFDNQEQN